MRGRAKVDPLSVVPTGIRSVSSAYDGDGGPCTLPWPLTSSALVSPAGHGVLACRPQSLRHVDRLCCYDWPLWDDECVHHAALAAGEQPAAGRGTSRSWPAPSDHGPGPATPQEKGAVPAKRSDVHGGTAAPDSTEPAVQVAVAGSPGHSAALAPRPRHTPPCDRSPARAPGPTTHRPLPRGEEVRARRHRAPPGGSESWTPPRPIAASVAQAARNLVMDTEDAGGTVQPCYGTETGNSPHPSTLSLPTGHQPRTQRRPHVEKELGRERVGTDVPGSPLERA